MRKRKTRFKSLLLDQALHRGRRQHLCRRGALAREASPAARRGETAAGRRAPPLPGDPRGAAARRIARRGSSIDDYTAPEGDGEMQEYLNVYQRTGAPCPRCGRPTRRIVIGQRGTHFCSWCQRLPSRERTGTIATLAASAVEGGAPRTALERAADGRGGRRRTAAPRLGGRRQGNDAGRKAPLQTATNRDGAADRVASRPVSVLRLDAIRREIGDFVILDDVSGSVARGERDRPGRAERRRQDDDARDRRQGTRSRTRGRVILGARHVDRDAPQEANLDPVFGAAPRRPCRRPRRRRRGRAAGGGACRARGAWRRSGRVAGLRAPARAVRAPGRVPPRPARGRGAVRPWHPARGLDSAPLHSSPAVSRRVPR